MSTKTADLRSFVKKRVQNTIFLYLIQVAYLLFLLISILTIVSPHVPAIAIVLILISSFSLIGYYYAIPNNLYQFSLDCGYTDKLTQTNHYVSEIIERIHQFTHLPRKKYRVLIFPELPSSPRITNLHQLQFSIASSVGFQNSSEACYHVPIHLVADDIDKLIATLIHETYHTQLDAKPLWKWTTLTTQGLVTFYHYLWILLLVLSGYWWIIIPSFYLSRTFLLFLINLHSRYAEKSADMLSVYCGFGAELIDTLTDFVDPESFSQSRSLYLDLTAEHYSTRTRTKYILNEMIALGQIDPSDLSN